MDTQDTPQPLILEAMRRILEESIAASLRAWEGRGIRGATGGLRFNPAPYDVPAELARVIATMAMAQVARPYGQRLAEMEELEADIANTHRVLFNAGGRGDTLEDMAKVVAAHAHPMAKLEVVAMSQALRTALADLAGLHDAMQPPSDGVRFEAFVGAIKAVVAAFRGELPPSATIELGTKEQGK